MPHVENDGVKIYYDSYGEGVPIVFLHPFSTNGGIWYFQTFPFAQTNHVIVIDHRGHGRSDKPATGYSIMEHADDVVAVLDALKVDRAVFVGNSIGGMIAMQLNLDHPQRVIGNLILSSGTGLGEGMPPEAGAAFQNDYIGAFGGLLEGAVSARSKRERPEILAVMKAHFSVPSNFPKHVFDAATADPNGVFAWNIKDRLSSIQAPTLVVAGEEDLVTTVANNQLLADNIPGAELRVINDVGHFYQLERPSEFNELLRGFVAAALEHHHHHH
uniref:Esterase n=1 Tax=uncultured bacterium TaxID=77133 RepID=UPI0008DB425C|nr:Chain A, Esterase [uncultured bacterium]5EGN_B Chain B, Esterase [uncultured bacterium]5EGN_C Chain C, Esterase [uncultured bacterium]5EGN_D Chain D, Esterase [uncultured bacterium]5EGN_E Chain E, Esterase [uncultured bacterium]5EGN_F Chain F, Esterase [uncultured bacterium]5EGN_G Chain G, Esterase [uncultured bacterium]5EGN_H Chain H, Esterase [uncultured bacterium]